MAQAPLWSPRCGRGTVVWAAAVPAVDVFPPPPQRGRPSASGAGGPVKVPSPVATGEG